MTAPVGMPRPLVFGEVLFDRFPDGSAVLGGAPFNVAWNLQALGLQPVLVSRIGRDGLGERIVDAMAGWGMDPAGLQRDDRRPTGTVEVTLDDGEPQYEIAPDRAYDHIAADDLPEPDPGALVYHGSLALRTPVPRPALQSLRGAAAGAFVDVNLRDPWWDPVHVRELLHGAKWAKLNGDELARLAPDEPDRDRRAQHLLAEADLQCLIVTLGADGAVAYGRDGWTRSPSPPDPAEVKDTVGAGDAFSAVVMLGLARRWPWPLILERAQELAGAVVGLRGATTTDRDFYAPFRRGWET